MHAASSSPALVPNSARADRSAEGNATIEIIEAPSNLGLRPLRVGHVPGAWRAPQALRDAGLYELLGARSVRSLERPPYFADPQPGTRILNGQTLRAFSETLANTVAEAVAGSGIPLVVGGDCSILLGCLAGARRSGPVGLIHIDGHSDFFHPGNYDTTQRLGSAAGMDLALATGRGEALLTQWNAMPMPLVPDADVVQVGEREEGDPDYAFKDIEDTEIRQLTVRKVKTLGIERAAQEIETHLLARRLERIWLHVDVDVLDETEMPAVDCPGRPGLTCSELSDLLARLCARLPMVGADVTVFDPDLDPAGHYAAKLADCLAKGFRPLGTAP